MSHSLSIPSLVSYDETIVNSDWYEIDRIINDACDRPGQVEYLVKWKSLDYSQCTWELEKDIKDKTKIDEYFSRLQHSNPKLIPSKFKRPPPTNYTEITEPVNSKVGTTLRSYQIEGLNWLRFCWYNRRNSILADEMGLGKTAQLVCMLNYLATSENITGPFLVLAPLSTLPHWKLEFERWTNLNCIIFHGDEESRKMIYEYEIQSFDERGTINPNRVAFDVMITNYDIFRSENKLLQSIEWRYLIADEGHKLKNYKSKIYLLMKQLKFEHCTLLTGTPLQNDMTELWSLLHFLNPEKFDDLKGFMKCYGNMEDSNQVEEIQKMIGNIMLRRKKGDVEKAILPKEETIIQVELTRIQKKLYRAFLHENAELLLQQIIKTKQLPSLLNLMMQLRKVCNHPFLIRDAEEGVITDMIGNNPDLELLSRTEIRQKAIVDSAGKMILIDKLLPKLKSDGHKVLIFSQMVRILDIIEDYLNMKHYTYERIDGSISQNDRESAINRFNEDPDRFIFLLSTKAGGIGINLTAANIVIIYDSDWNPQNDIQAQARCHRIGQKSVVKVYRLITRGTYESQMFERASKKLGLDHVVLDGGDFREKPMKAAEIEKMLREGAYGIFNDDDTELDNFCSADIEQILTKRATVYKEDIVAGGGSVFAKASFNVDEDDIDVNAPDFWSKVLPESQSLESLDEEDDLKVRKCRQNHVNNFEIDKRIKIKKIINKMINHGLVNLDEDHEKYSKIILRIALSVHECNDKNSYIILRHVIRESIKNLIAIEIEDPVKEYGETAFIVEERADEIMERVAFFLRLERVLYFIQGNIEEWPSIFPIWESPEYEYALMLGVYNYGWKDLIQIINDPILGLSETKPLKRSAIERRVQKLYEEIEKQFNTEKYFIPKYIITENKLKFAVPKIWKKSHKKLLAREFLYEHEFEYLIQTITSYGLPKIDISNYDFERIKLLSNLTCVVLSTIQNTIEDLLSYLQNEYSTTEFALDDLVDFKGYQSLNNFSEVITYRQLKKAYQSIREMEVIYDFLIEATPKHWALIKNVPHNKQLPNWWGHEEDEALIRALGQYGLSIISTFIIDPHLPFRKHIPRIAVSLVEKHAKAEKRGTNSKFNRPKQEVGTLSYIYRERSRINRALTVIKYVNERFKELQTKQTLTKKKKSKVNIYVSRPTTRLLIISYGDIKLNPNFSFEKFDFPPGYQCDRMYVGKSDNTLIWYRCEILDGGDYPIFKVIINADDKKNKIEVEADSIDGIAKKIMKVLKFKDNKSKDEFETGIKLFGLNNPTVMRVLGGMKENCLEEENVENNEEEDDEKTPNFEIIMPSFDRALFHNKKIEHI
ncbi:SNF2 family N-terminal domain containing protein [Histomonas meleagridis]|uniref:SNF2 family N-terminal domain containing protein n=1 Tax=Histomonas meleagridis TaxID=135588 RepID=UPI00355A07E8|nr:SNF2 family N-terminal domain containing protein [Histomonas meleagridis]KAH0801424.1 SNF2 family N-terminal domain containing protein [Histomonas meleagridis]